MNRNFLNQTEMAEMARDVGIKKATNKSINLFILALMAGAFIALAGAGSTMASFNLLAKPETYGLGRALLGAYFAAGLMFVVIAGAELFTGNTLIVMSVMEKKVTWGQMFRNWGIVYLGNLVGSVVIAYMVNATMVFNGGGHMLGGMILRIASGKVALSFTSAFVSGILCNMIVCIAVWMSWAALDIAGKCISIFFAISLFAMSGYEHSVANMFYVPAAIFAKLNPNWVEASGLSADAIANINWGTFFAGNLLPVTLGNIVGGMVVVGLTYWFVYLKKN